MTVELAVCLPVILAVVAILVNALSYLEACARFDRVAAEAVRTQAASPGYGASGSDLRARRVCEAIDATFEDYGNISVEVVALKGAGESGVAGAGGLSASDTGLQANTLFSLLTRLETYRCTLHYQPLGFGGSFFGLRFFDLSHANSYTIDPFRPGVIG